MGLFENKNAPKHSPSFTTTYPPTSSSTRRPIASRGSWIGNASLQLLWEVAARVPQLLGGPEVDDSSSIPDAAPSPEAGADELHGELRERLEQMLLRLIFTMRWEANPDCNM